MTLNSLTQLEKIQVMEHGWLLCPKMDLIICRELDIFCLFSSRFRAKPQGCYIIYWLRIGSHTGDMRGGGGRYRQRSVELPFHHLFHQIPTDIQKEERRIRAWYSLAFWAWRLLSGWNLMATLKVLSSDRPLCPVHCDSVSLGSPPHLLWPSLGSSYPSLPSQFLHILQSSAQLPFS